MVTTKRFAYKVLRDYFDKCEAEFDYAYSNGCTTILGARKVGKTILMQQLCADKPDSSVYMDCASLEEDFSFEEFFKDCLNKGVSRVYLDEVCKIDSELIGDFVAFVKLYSSEILITITGSVKASVSRLSNQIGRGYTIELPPITYSERLAWAGKESSDELFKMYLRTNTVASSLSDTQIESEWKRYIGFVVNDTLSSYLRRTSLEGYTELPSTDNIMSALRYVSLCQFVYKNDAGKFVDIPALPRELKSSIPDYKLLKCKYGLTNEEIKLTCSLLLVSGLARQVSAINTSNIPSSDVVTLHKIDVDVPAMIFEYPWFVSYAISDKLCNCDSLLDFWLENELMLKMSYLYRYVDKYRSSDAEELDIVYSVGDSAMGSLSGVRFDNEFSIMRNDLIALALEKEYFSRCYNQFNGGDAPVFCEKTVLQLVHEHCADMLDDSDK